MQHFNRCFEHLNKFHDPLVGAAQRTGIAVSVRIVLGVVFEFANIYFSHQRGNILVVLIARFRFGNGNLLQNRRPHFDHAEFSDVATKFMQTFCRPRRHNGAKVAAWNAVLFFKDLRIFLWIEQTERMIVNRASLSVSAQYINRHALH